MDDKTNHAIDYQIESLANPVEKEELREHDFGEVILVQGGDVRRIPVPTNDPNDPLNFPQWRRIGAIGTCCWFSLFALLSLSGLGTFLNTLFQLYSPAHTPTQIVGLTTYPTMVTTFGALLLLPLSLVLGRRPVFLGSALVMFICILTAGTSKSFNAHLTSRIIAGFATGSTESILPLIITDLTFMDERNFYFGLYWSVQNCINAALLISFSYLTSDAGWRWFYWIFAIAVGISAVLIIFFVPETKYWRSPRSINGQVIFTDEFGDTHVLSDAEARARLGTVQEFTVPENTTKRSLWQELKPWSDVSPHAMRKLIGAYAKIARAATSPGVLYALAISSITLGLGIAITLVYSTVLETRFGWQAKSVGLFNVGIIPACFVAMFYAGYCADKINIWLAKRNQGIHKSEHHLILLAPAFVAATIGVTAIAVCANYPERYSAWGLVIGWAIFQFAFTSIMITVTTFAAEVIPESPGAALVVVVAGKNLVSFGASQGIVPMVQKYNYLTSFMILLGIFLGIGLLGVPVYFLNGRWRKYMSTKSTT